MNICDDKEGKATKMIAGHLYQWKQDSSVNGLRICVDTRRDGNFVKQLSLFKITSGAIASWYCDSHQDSRYTDVTDQYCLKKIEE